MTCCTGSTCTLASGILDLARLETHINASQVEYLHHHKLDPQLEAHLSNTTLETDLAKATADTISAAGRFLGSSLKIDSGDGEQHMVITVHFPRLHESWVLGEESRLRKKLAAYDPGLAASLDWAASLQARFGKKIQLREVARHLVSYSVSTSHLKVQPRRLSSISVPQRLYCTRFC